VIVFLSLQVVSLAGSRDWIGEALSVRVFFPNTEDF